MIMKHISIVLLAGLAAVAFACTKETTPEQTAPEPQEMGVGGVILSALTAHCIFHQVKFA